MKIIFVAVYRHRGRMFRPIKLIAIEDFSHFLFFERAKAKEFLGFGAYTAAQKTNKCVKNTIDINFKDYVAHTWTLKTGITALCITDKEYPVDIAYRLLLRVMDKTQRALKDKWKIVKTDAEITPPFLEKMFKEYQNPKEIKDQAKFEKIKKQA